MSYYASTLRPTVEEPSVFTSFVEGSMQYRVPVAMRMLDARIEALARSQASGAGLAALLQEEDKNTVRLLESAQKLRGDALAAEGVRKTGVADIFKAAEGTEQALLSGNATISAANVRAFADVEGARIGQSTEEMKAANNLNLEKQKQLGVMEKTFAEGGKLEGPAVESIRDQLNRDIDNALKSGAEVSPEAWMASMDSLADRVSRLPNPVTRKAMEAEILNTVDRLKGATEGDRTTLAGLARLRFAQTEENAPSGEAFLPQGAGYRGRTPGAALLTGPKQGVPERVEDAARGVVGARNITGGVGLEGGGGETVEGSGSGDRARGAIDELNRGPDEDPLLKRLMAEIDASGARKKALEDAVKAGNADPFGGLGGFFDPIGGDASRKAPKTRMERARAASSMEAPRAMATETPSEVMPEKKALAQSGARKAFASELDGLAELKRRTTGGRKKKTSELEAM